MGDSWPRVGKCYLTGGQFRGADPVDALSHRTMVSNVCAHVLCMETANRVQTVVCDLLLAVVPSGVMSSADSCYKRLQDWA